MATTTLTATTLVEAAKSGREGAAKSIAARTDGPPTLLPNEIRSTARAPWVAVRVLDTDRLSWERLDIWDRKVLFENKETGDHLMIISIPPGWPGGLSHYHTFHEWAYALSGDLTNNEYTSPDQRLGVLMQYREGYFLDRPAYSLHGGEKGRLESQVGGSVLIMEEGGRTISVIPGTPGYSEEYKQVKLWSVPRIIDTIGMIPWEPEPSVPGLHVKRLVNDQTRGFRALLWWLSAGWDSSQSPQSARAFYYKQAYQFNFVLAGDLKIQTYKTPGEKAEKIALGKYSYVERAPMSIFGLADRIVTERGCVWLEVTYGQGTAMSHTPIEEPTYV